MSDNTEKIQGDTKFKKGQSGNLKGRPKGSKNKSTIAAETLLEGSLERICRRVENEALNGNMQAAKMILDRILPAKRDRAIKIDLPQIHNGKDILKAVGAIMNAIASGEISPSEGESLSRILEKYSNALELHQFESRLSALETSAKQ